MKTTAGEKAFLGLCLAIVAGGLFLVGDWVVAACGSRAYYRAVVVDRGYHPPQTHIGNGIDSKGNATISVSSTPEQFNVIFRFDGGAVQAVSVRPEYWAACKPGDRARLGYKSGVVWSWCESVAQE